MTSQPKISTPAHIAIIMDGNGRWAKQRFLPRIAGHRAGVEAARKAVKNCVKRNIKVLSLFAFSSENWRRPAKEVSYLMEIFLSGLEREVGMLHENNIQLRFIGDRTRFSEKLFQKILEVEKLTAKNSGMVLIIAVDYGGRWDITDACRKLAIEVEAGKLSGSAITSELISSKLSFADLPDPDLFIRTSGELRISNFMLWQLAYSELYFCKSLWPDFDETELDNALTHYAERDRRVGSSTEQEVLK
jgi:undecaprenyl diphosphate synthase